MKIKIKSKGNFINVIRLAAGIAGTVQGFIIKEIALSLAGFFLVYMAVAGRKNLKVELKEVTSTSKEIEYEKVDARL